MSLTQEQHEAVDYKILKCKAAVMNEYKSTAIDMQILKDEFEDFKDQIYQTLTAHELQRKDMNESLETQISALSDKLTRYSENDMTKYIEIKDMLSKLIDDTSENTKYISKKEHEDNINNEVNKRLDEANAPGKAIWDKVKMTAVSLITGAILIALGSGALFVYDLYQKMEGN